MKKFSNLIEAIEYQCTNSFNGITLIKDREDDLYFSYNTLFNKAKVVLSEFRKIGLEKGDEVIIQFENPRDFIISFWASVLGGYIPVPIAFGINMEQKIKIVRIWDILKNPILVTTTSILDKLNTFSTQNNLLDFQAQINERHMLYDYDELEYADSADVEFQKISPKDIAFIQFSSGSTGSPKGVTVTHESLMINIDAMSSALQLAGNDRFLSWMPLFHDMGLVGFHLMPLVRGLGQGIINTSLFIRMPYIWMQKVSEYRATIVASPNFGYQHYLNYYFRHTDNKEKYDIDISSIRVFTNGAEPISLKLCNRFCEIMKQYGLRDNCMFPVYGLAEATLGAAFPSLQSKVNNVRISRGHTSVGDAIQVIDSETEGFDVVELGYSLECNEIIITNFDNEILPEGYIGCIQLKGANVTKGYYNNPEATKQAISDEGWFNTGDLGFIKDKCLYVTGRVKDVIFVNGQNFYANDIEHALSNIPGAEIGRVAAVGCFDYQIGFDQIILFSIYKSSNEEEFNKFSISLVDEIFKRLNIKVHRVIGVKALQKTTSGKIQRFKIKEEYLKDEYNDHITYFNIT